MPAIYMPRSKPIIGAINGVSVGVGLTMTLPMDIRIASEAARFSMRFVRMGITPEVGSTLYLPQIVGLQNALETMDDRAHHRCTGCPRLRPCIARRACRSPAANSDGTCGRNRL